MRALRRAALALGLASLAAGIVRLRGRGGKPPTSTTWQELPVADDLVIDATSTDHDAPSSH